MKPGEMLPRAKDPLERKPGERPGQSLPWSLRGGRPYLDFRLLVSRTMQQVSVVLSLPVVVGLDSSPRMCIQLSSASLG